MLQQDVQDISPAPGTGLVQGCVARIVTVIHILTVLLEAVENNVLWGWGQLCEQRKVSFLESFLLDSPLHKCLTNLKACPLYVGTKDTFQNLVWTKSVLSLHCQSPSSELFPWQEKDISYD